MSPFSRDPEELLSHRDFVRGLARNLVVDEARADDVVQQAWVAALAGGPKEASSLRAWLGAVVRNLVWKGRRDDTRRRERERKAAQAGELPSTVDVVEREAARRAVTDAVFALGEPFRTTLILRHIEGLPQREIARRMQVPVETVHSRLRTGMTRLRRRLDAEFGDRRAWSLLLVPGAVPSATTGLSSVVSSIVAGVALVSLKAKFAFSVLALAVAALMFQSFGPGSGTPEDGVGKKEKVAVAAAPELDPVELPPEADTHREELANDPEIDPDPPLASETELVDPTRGDIEITVVYAEDGSPAASVGIKVYCWGEPDPYFNLRYGRTDENGVAKIEGILEGGVAVEADRGGSARLGVVAGEVASGRLEIPSGSMVTGVVVDDQGRPIPGADIFMTSQGLNSDGFVVAQSGNDGRFAIRAVQSLHYVGARATGYAPSKLPMVMGSEGAEHDLTLKLDQRGGSVLGRVFGPDGNPMRRALVVVDVEARNTIRLDDGKQALEAIEQRVYTDEAGAFRFDGVAAGTHSIGVRRPELGPWRDNVEVFEGVAAQVEVRLDRGAVLVGTVVGANGSPASRVTLLARQTDGFDEVYGRADASGAFRLEGLPAGTVNVEVSSDDQGKFEEDVVLVAGEETRWDVKLSLGRSILGRLVDEADRPLAGHWIRAEIDFRYSPEFYNSGDYFRGDAETDADGRFEITNCPDAALKLEINTPNTWMFPSLTKGNVRAGPDEVLLRLNNETRPTARIIGTVVDASGSPIAGAKISPIRTGANGSPILTSDAETGAFVIEPLPPGSYRVSVEADGFPNFVTPFHELASNETWDIGAVRFDEAGQLVVVPVRDADCPDAEIHPWIERDGTGMSYKLEQDGDQYRSEPLGAGSYHLFVASPPLAAIAIPFQIASGSETHVELPLQTGVEQRILIETESQAFHLRITGKVGVVFEGREWSRSPREVFEKRLAFSPGAYEVTATDDAGRVAHGSFSISEDAAPEAVELTLR